MPDNNTPLRLIKRQVRVIWAVYSVAPLFLVFVAYQLIVNRTAPPSEIFGWAAPACVAMGIIEAISALVIYRKLPRSMLSPMKSLDSHMAKHPTIGEVDRRAAEVASGVGKIMIILSAFSMSCAIFGMIIVILGGELWNMIPFVAVSLILQLIFRPNEAFFRRVEDKLGYGQQGGAK